MKVALYARVSTSDKDQEPETQLQPLREFAAAHNWTVAGEYVDHASATDLRGRSEWRDLLDKAAKRRVDCILVWKLDRAFRSVAHMAQTVEQLRRWGVGLRSYSEPWLDTSGTSLVADLMLNILASFAQFEKALIAERVRAGMAREAAGRPRWAADESERQPRRAPARDRGRHLVPQCSGPAVGRHAVGGLAGLEKGWSERRG